MSGLGIGMSKRQYDIRKGRSTDDELRVVHEHIVYECSVRRVIRVALIFAVPSTQ